MPFFIFIYMKSRLPAGYWTIDRCTKEALKYNSRREFKQKSKKAWDITLKRGWLDIVCPHLPAIYKKKNYWTKDKCIEEALKYKSRIDFEKGSLSACLAARRNGWIDEICTHMHIIGNREKRCIYAVEFEDNHIYIGLTYNTRARFSDHLKDINSGVYKHIQKTGLIPIFKKLTDYIDVVDASKLEGITSQSYKKAGWILLNKAKCGAVGGGTLKWTKDKCIEEAMGCKTKGEFKKKNRSAYNSALSHKWIDEIFNNKKT